MKKSVIIFSAIVLGATACHKANDSASGGEDFTTLEGNVIQDFTNSLVMYRYTSLVGAAQSMKTSVNTLTATVNDANQADAKSKWKDIRSVWEQSEGFLIGPVESEDYDPNTDTWPTDYIQMDSLLASSNPLTTNDVQNLSQSLRGYHPLEYMLWGKGGIKTPADFTGRQKLYMNSLIDDLLSNNVQPLYDSWFSGTDNYKEQVVTAGQGSTQFPTRKALFLNIVSVMNDICDEVGSSKMYEPFIARDSTITESPYSNNTLVDFKNNILGMQQVYTGLNGGRGIGALVAAKQSDLDSRIKTAINAALVSFDQITERYEEAIFDQRNQVQNTMNALAAVKTLLEEDLTDFINTNIKD